MERTRTIALTVHYDLRYARVKGTDLLLDLYLPARRPQRPLPLVVFIHGGAWRKGSKWDGAHLAPRMVRRGFAYASMTYRLSQAAIFPAQIEDAKAAIRFLRANAREHRIDPERVGVWGESAGGHLCALLGTAGHARDLDRSGGNVRVSSRVQAVCDCYGPTDFLQMDAHALPGSDTRFADADSPTSRLVGAPIETVPELCAHANPVTYIRRDDCPPFLILHGAADNRVPPHQSVLLHEALVAAGVDSTLRLIEGAGHSPVVYTDPERLAWIERFFARRLRARKR
jgi:acetyl esterase/lipase